MAHSLYTYPGNFRAFKALIAAEYAGVDIEVPEFDMVRRSRVSKTKTRVSCLRDKLWRLADLGGTLFARGYPQHTFGGAPSQSCSLSLSLETAVLPWGVG